MARKCRMVVIVMGLVVVGMLAVEQQTRAVPLTLDTKKLCKSSVSSLKAYLTEEPEVGGGAGSLLGSGSMSLGCEGTNPIDSCDLCVEMVCSWEFVTGEFAIEPQSRVTSINVVDCGDSDFEAITNSHATNKYFIHRIKVTVYDGECNANADVLGFKTDDENFDGIEDM